jgi:hypothetical protein
MISLRLIVPAVLVAAAVAACVSYFVVAPSLEADQRLLPTPPNMKGPLTGTPVNIDQHLSAEAQVVADFTRASKMILRRLPEASADANDLPITGHIPLPRRRPVPASVTP